MKHKLETNPTLTITFDQGEVVDLIRFLQFCDLNEKVNATPCVLLRTLLEAVGP